MSGRRRFLIVLATLAGLLLLAALSAPWWFNARQVTALALERAGTATGLEWRIDGEPELRWRPRPWLALPALTIRDAQGRRVLAAERVELALPWTTLRGDDLRIEAIRIEAPDIDLDAALDWWNAQPETRDTALPVIDGLRVVRGRLLSGGTRVEGIDLALPRFAIGEPMALDVSGRVSVMQADGASAHAPAAPFRFELNLDATPQAGPLRLESLRLVLDGDGPVPPVNATGRLQFAPWQLRLEGEAARWPAAWAALPAPLSASTAPLAFVLVQEGSDALDAEARLHVRRDGAELHAELRPQAVLAWLDDEAAALLPPLRAQAALPLLEMDGIRLEGVSVQIESIEPGSADTESDPASTPRR